MAPGEDESRMGEINGVTEISTEKVSASAVWFSHGRA